MSAEALWLTEDDVCSLVDLPGAIEVLSEGLEAEARGEAENMAKTHASWGRGNTLHALGATFAAAGFAGTKTWAHTDGGATPLLIVFNARDGSLVAVIEAFALGQLRTGAISAIATRWLAARGADVLGIVGSGQQAMMQVAAVAAVRRLAQVRVFSPNAEHRCAFADRVRAAFDCAVIEAASVSEAVAPAPIITLVTRATEPFLLADMVQRGAHINAVGAIVPTRAELAPELLARCARVVVDSLAVVQSLSRELGEYYGRGHGSWADVLPLSRVVHERATRPDGADLTLFKAMGMGISDLSLGIEVCRRAVQHGVGRRFPHPQNVPVDRLIVRERS